jgi:hypothetical protein
MIIWYSSTFSELLEADFVSEQRERCLKVARDLLAAGRSVAIGIPLPIYGWTSSTFLEADRE